MADLQDENHQNQNEIKVEKKRTSLLAQILPRKRVIEKARRSFIGLTRKKSAYEHSSSSIIFSNDEPLIERARKSIIGMTQRRSQRKSCPATIVFDSGEIERGKNVVETCAFIPRVYEENEVEAVKRIQVVFREHKKRLERLGEEEEAKKSPITVALEWSFSVGRLPSGTE
jgi:hypothetical protein